MERCGENEHPTLVSLFSYQFTTLDHLQYIGRWIIHTHDIATTLYGIIELRRRSCGDVTVDNDVAVLF